mgnify:CR=1 FL=1
MDSLLDRPRIAAFDVVGKSPKNKMLFGEEFMRRTWRTQRRRLIAGTVGLAMGIICLADRADSQAMTEVTFIVVNNLFSTPAFVAVENGYWTTQGLNVKIKLTSSGRQVTQSLQAGEAQFGHAALSTTTASARASGKHAQRRDALLQCR